MAAAHRSSGQPLFPHRLQLPISLRLPPRRCKPSRDPPWLVIHRPTLSLGSRLATIGVVALRRSEVRAQRPSSSGANYRPAKKPGQRGALSMRIEHLTHERHEVVGQPRCALAQLVEQYGDVAVSTPRSAARSVVVVMPDDGSHGRRPGTPPRTGASRDRGPHPAGTRTTRLGRSLPQASVSPADLRVHPRRSRFPPGGHRRRRGEAACRTTSSGRVGAPALLEDHQDDREGTTPPRSSTGFKHCSRPSPEFWNPTGH